MTPKEKATELLEKYRAISDSYKKEQQCALIAVDECILCCDNYYVDPYANQLSAEIFWQQVKKEIELL